MTWYNDLYNAFNNERNRVDRYQEKALDIKLDTYWKNKSMQREDTRFQRMAKDAKEAGFHPTAVIGQTPGSGAMANNVGSTSPSGAPRFSEGGPVANALGIKS